MLLMAKTSRQVMNFLVSSGRAISDNACDDLLLACCAMARSHKKQFNIRTSEMEGRIITNWTQSGMGNVWGYVFSATLEMNAGRTFVRYIISFDDLDLEELDLTRLQALWGPWQEADESSPTVH
jgi:hypothetical protein